MTTPFVVFGLPRSRTFWLAQFLSYGGWFCGHDEVRHVRSLDDVKSWFALEGFGTCETAAAPFWRLMMDIRPDTRVVVVRRPIADVTASLIATGVQFDIGAVAKLLTRLSRKLDQIERHVPDVVSVDYADLADEATCKRVFEHCLPFPHDTAWWQRLNAINLQTDLAAQMRYVQAHGPQLRAVERVCARRIRSMLRPSRLGRPDEFGISVQEELFFVAWEDAKVIMGEHCVRVGEDPDMWRSLNVPLMEKFDEVGQMVVVTARCNGRMLGYLGSVLSQSLERVGLIQATQLGLFVCDDGAGHGLAMRLTRAAIDAAFARGAKQVFMRSGVRGDGPRVHTVFRRLGAKDHGQMFKLEAA